MPLLELHVVGVDAEARALLLSDRTDGRGGRFWVSVDEHFVATVDLAMVEAARHPAIPARPPAPPPAPAAPHASGPRLTPGTKSTRSRPPRAARTAAPVPPAAPASPRQPAPVPRPAPTPAGPAPAPAPPASPRPSGTVPASHPAARPLPGPVSSLSPREIQARLRQGRSVAEVARDAGVGADWIDRFAAPIIAEQRAAIERAGRLRFATPRRGESALPLAEAVHRNLLRRGVRLSPAEIAQRWSAFHQDAGQWVVRFEYLHRRRAFRADWLVDVHARTLSSINPLAAQLAFADDALTSLTFEPAQPRPAPRSSTRSSPTRSSPTSRAPARRGAAPDPVAAVPAEARGVASSEPAAVMPRDRVAATTRVPAGARATLPAATGDGADPPAPGASSRRGRARPPRVTGAPRGNDAEVPADASPSPAQPSARPARRRGTDPSSGRTPRARS
ncbi:MAG: septation protein SepH [Acidimicrobiales bacterium]